jgi:hypothetical protein
LESLAVPACSCSNMVPKKSADQKRIKKGSHIALFSERSALRTASTKTA